MTLDNMPNKPQDLPQGFSLRLISNLKTNSYALVLYHRIQDSILYCAHDISTTIFPGRRIYNFQDVLDIINDYLPKMIEGLTLKTAAKSENG